MEQDLRRLYQVKTEFLLEPLFKFMEIMKQFPPNEYMLRHSEKHNAQAMVYVKSDHSRFDHDVILLFSVHFKNSIFFQSSSNTTQVADIYKSHEVDTSILENIPWSPIDDTICTVIHKRSAVMPCAFPHWGEQNKAQSNDRLYLVQKAVEKGQQKLDAISKRNKFIQKRKTLKKQRAKQKNKQLDKRAKLKFEGESLDPNELFDERGNIHNLGLPNLPESTSLFNHKEVNNQPEEESILSESMSFDAYCRDAAVISHDSIDP